MCNPMFKTVGFVNFNYCQNIHEFDVYYARLILYIDFCSRDYPRFRANACRAPTDDACALVTPTFGMTKL